MAIGSAILAAHSINIASGATPARRISCLGIAMPDPGATAEVEALHKALVNLVAAARPHVDNGSRSLAVTIERADDALAAFHSLRASSQERPPEGGGKREWTIWACRRDDCDWGGCLSLEAAPPGERPYCPGSRGHETRHKLSLVEAVARQLGVSEQPTDRGNEEE